MAYRLVVSDESPPDDVPKVGVFYYVEGEILMDAQPMNEVEPYEDEVQWGRHDNLWDSLEPKTEIERRFKSMPYDTYPRGRVVYDINSKRFYMYVEGCMIVLDEIVPAVIKFGLVKVDLYVEGDPNYKCAKCRKNFIGGRILR